MKKAIYAGSFDPLTNGHIYVIKQSLKLFDELIISVGEHPDKKYTFSLEERLDLLKSVFEKEISTCKVEIDYFENKYLCDYAKQKQCPVIIRGLRAGDFDYEFEMASFNADVKLGWEKIVTVWIPTLKSLSGLSSSFVKSLCGPDGWEKRVEQMVPSQVLSKLKNTIK